jgi:hypothetical protein
MQMARVHWGGIAMKIVYNGAGKKCTMWWMIFLLTFIRSPGPKVEISVNRSILLALTAMLNIRLERKTDTL